VSEIKPIVLGFRAFATVALCKGTFRLCSARLQAGIC
jgi:hypothetical protein